MLSNMVAGASEVATEMGKSRWMEEGGRWGRGNNHFKDIFLLSSLSVHGVWEQRYLEGKEDNVIS